MKYFYFPLILFLLIFNLIFIKTGHIYSNEPTTEYQNEGYLSKIVLSFKLENYLEAKEVLKIVWPFNFTDA